MEECLLSLPSCVGAKASGFQDQVKATWRLQEKDYVKYYGGLIFHQRFFVLDVLDFIFSLFPLAKTSLTCVWESPLWMKLKKTFVLTLEASQARRPQHQRCMPKKNSISDFLSLFIVIFPIYLISLQQL